MLVPLAPDDVSEFSCLFLDETKYNIEILLIRHAKQDHRCSNNYSMITYLSVFHEKSNIPFHYYLLDNGIV